MIIVFDENGYEMESSVNRSSGISLEKNKNGIFNEYVRLSTVRHSYYYLETPLTNVFLNTLITMKSRGTPGTK